MPSSHRRSDKRGNWVCRGLTQCLFEGSCSSNSIEKFSLLGLLVPDIFSLACMEFHWACFTLFRAILFQFAFPLGCFAWPGPEGDSGLTMRVKFSRMGFWGLEISWASWGNGLGRPTKESSSLMFPSEASVLCWSREEPSDLGTVRLHPWFSADWKVVPSSLSATLGVSPFPIWPQLEFLALTVTPNLDLMKLPLPVLISHWTFLIAPYQHPSYFEAWVFQSYPFGFHLPLSILHIVLRSWECVNGVDSASHCGQAIRIGSKRWEISHTWRWPTFFLLQG